MKLSVIIPAYNEEQTIAPLLDKVLEAELPDNTAKEIIVVNDGATDGTAAIVDRYVKKDQVRLFHQNNMGKTAGVLKGISESTGDIIIIQDADLEYDPSQYAELIQPIIDGKQSVVYGSRFMGTIENMRFPMRLANIMTNITLNMIYKTKLTDNNTCYKVFKKDISEQLFIEEFISKWLFDVEIFFRMYQIYGKEKAVNKMEEIPLISWIDHGGSKVSMLYFFKLWFDLNNINNKYKKHFT